MTGNIHSQAATVPHEDTGGRVGRVVALLAALLFVQHGVVHFMGFAWAFGLIGPGAITDGYTLVAGLDPSGWAMRALGVAWLLPSPLYLVASAGLVLLHAWWQTWALAATVISLALCVLWLQPAVIGVAVDVAILAGLAVYVAITRRPAP